MISSAIAFVLIVVLGLWIFSKTKGLIKLGGVPLFLLVTVEYFIFVVIVVTAFR